MTSQLSSFALISTIGLMLSGQLFAQGERGKEIYQSQCASCHGELGQGVAGKYQGTLQGDLSLESLTEVIEGTMPDDDPDQCVDQDADAVAKYVFDEFYSASAQAEKLAPLQLLHRTNQQYRSAIADLAAHFSGKLWVDQTISGRGFKGKYFSSRNFDSTKSIGERIDQKLEFDFGKGSPLIPEKEMEEFGIQWHAALRVEESGRYDFYLDSPNGIRLYVNDARTPVIDAWVSSGNDQHEASVFLIAGQSYLIKVDMFKYKEDQASISLKWCPPYGKPEPIPKENLLPVWAPMVVVSQTVLPPDDSSRGYERGSTVSKAWLEATSASAIQFANRVLGDQKKFMGIKNNDPEKEEKLRKFCQRLAKFAFSSPLTPEQIELYIDRLFQHAESPEAAAKQSIILTLSSPRFLYPELGAEEPDVYTVAARLALIYWDSIPDQQLWAAASSGNLSKAWSIEHHLNRMLDDPRTKAKVRGFFHDWLEMDAGDLSKDQELYPSFNRAIAADLRKSLELFLDDVVWSEASDYRRIYDSDEIYLSSLMADHYGIGTKDSNGANPDDGEVPSSLGNNENASFEGFRKFKTNPLQRAGILTHPYLMTGLAYHRTTSPIHRGVFVARRLIGRTLKQPPENFEPLKEDFDPTMTTRERVAYQTKDKSCMNCHSFINPLGFSLEGFDAVGNLRRRENGKPIDSSSTYTTENGESVELRGARDLANYLVISEKAQRNFVKHLFQYLVKHPPSAYGHGTLDLLHSSFVQNDFNIKKLIKDITKLAVLHGTETASTKSDRVNPKSEPGNVGAKIRHWPEAVGAAIEPAGVSQ